MNARSGYEAHDTHEPHGIHEPHGTYGVHEGLYGTYDPCDTYGAREAYGASVARSARPEAARGTASESADPVRGLMLRHRELCERAVDPLEIAAGLEAHGVTDRTAACFRHRDVFSLADELYARVPRAEGHPGDDGTRPGPLAEESAARRRGPRAPRCPGGRPGRPGALAHLLLLLPGAAGATALAALAHTRDAPGPAHAALVLAGALTVAAAVRLALRSVAFTAPTVLCACLLACYALLGDGLLSRLTGGPPAGTGRCAPLTLALAVAPAAWCARWFALRARRALGRSRSLGEFAAAVRPALAAACALFALGLPGIEQAVHPIAARLTAADGHGSAPRVAVATGAGAATLTLGLLLFCALLLSAHGFTAAASAGLGAACAVEAAALACPLVARLTGIDAVGRPVEAAVAAFGPAAVPTAACACAALALLAYARGALTGASAHHWPAAP